jgi:hypothetical protein
VYFTIQAHREITLKVRVRFGAIAKDIEPGIYSSVSNPFEKEKELYVKYGTFPINFNHFYKRTS